MQQLPSFLKSTPKLIFVIVLSVIVLNPLAIELPVSTRGDRVSETAAYGKRRGGRSGGGSFRRNTRSSGSSGSSGSRSSSPSRSTTSPSRSTTSPSTPSPSTTSPSRSTPNSQRNNTTPTPTSSSSPRNSTVPLSPVTPRNSSTTVVPVVPSSNRSRTATSSTPRFVYYGRNRFNPVFMFFLMGAGGILIFFISFYLLKKAFATTGTASATAPPMARDRERDNDIVTLSKIQVALLATATEVQEQLSQISLSADTETEEGLWELLRETLLVLNRNEEHWTHGFSSSEKVKIQDAETKFDRWCFEERSRFSGESLVNANGKVRSQENGSVQNRAEGMYIVVTLLLGTANDRPLFEDVHSVTDVKNALATLSGLRRDYLMTFYLLWTPQQAPESLDYDEMLSEYPFMYQLV